MNPEAFHFLRPAWLLALGLLVPLAWWARRRRSDAGGWRAVCDAHLLPHVLVPGRGRAAAGPFALLALGWTAACLALAGPTWERLPQPAFGDPARTIFALSLAPSMERDDVAPSRLARARHKLRDAIDRIEGGEVGLVVFREEAYGAVPLTDDADVVREMLPILRSDLAPGREARPARALVEAGRMLDAVGADGARVVLVTDGSDAEPRATLEAARDLSRRGAALSVLSVAPDEVPGLAELAAAGGGALATLSAGDADLDGILAAGSGASIGARLSRSDAQADVWWDAGAWLVWAPLLAAALGFRRGWLAAAVALAWIGLPAAPAEAGFAEWFQTPDQRGARAFDAGRFAESAESFDDPGWRAAALYRAGDFARAAEALRPLEDGRSQYNLGNALARSGSLEEALAAYDHSLAAAPDDEDARFNRDLVQRLLDEQRQQESPDERGGDGARADDGNDDGKAGGDGEKGRDEGADAGRNDPGDGERGPDEAAQDGGSAEAAEADGGSEAQRAPAPSAASDAEADSSDVAPGSPRDAANGSTDARSPRDPWLAHLPDDPGGLLREKLRRDYLRKQEARQRGDLL